MDPISCNLNNMFVQLFRDSLNEYVYAADLAGLQWEISISKYGIIVSNYIIIKLIILNKQYSKISYNLCRYFRVRIEHYWNNFLSTYHFVESNLILYLLFDICTHVHNFAST